MLRASRASGTAAAREGEAPRLSDNHCAANSLATSLPIHRSLQAQYEQLTNAAIH